MVGRIVELNAAKVGLRSPVGMVTDSTVICSGSWIGTLRSGMVYRAWDGRLRAGGELQSPVHRFFRL